jgi:hypothetical protein
VSSIFTPVEARCRARPPIERGAPPHPRVPTRNGYPTVTSSQSARTSTRHRPLPLVTVTLIAGLIGGGFAIAESMPAGAVDSSSSATTGTAELESMQLPTLATGVTDTTAPAAATPLDALALSGPQQPTLLSTVVATVAMLLGSALVALTAFRRRSPRH